VKGGRLEVTVEKGVVTIRGKVEKEKYKQKAERLTSKVQGVKKVVNELKVDPTT
jgi:osmotically-inducible protein OsmY